MGRLLEFFKVGLWTHDLRREVFWRRYGLGALRVGAYAILNYRRNLTGIRASGITLITLLSIVPCLLLVFGIAKGFGYGEELETSMVSYSAELPTQFREVSDQIRELLGRTSFSTLGWLGTLFLVWTGITLFSKVEQALNHAWRTTNRRPWVRRVTDFIALVVIVPVLFLGALSLSSMLTGGGVIVSLRENLPIIGALYDMGLGFVPYVMTWIAFTAVYKIMPSADVTWRAAFVGGVVAGSGWLIMHSCYIRFQVGAARMNAIYATLAAIPLLLVYLQLAWTITLLGTEVAYGVQHVHLLGSARIDEESSFATRERLGLAIVEQAAKRFDAGDGATSLADLAAQVELPREWLDAICADLIRAKVLASVDNGEKVIPAQPLENLALTTVRDALRGSCRSDLQARLPISPLLDTKLADARRAANQAIESHRFG